MSQVRVRFAPSPTGFFHIGSARTALFNWLYARHTEGRFILRVEDTDRARNTEEALRVLLEGLRWLGLDWDEGPGVDGPHGPYFQSERGDIYREYLQKLRDAGRAYDKDGAVWFRLLGDRYTEYDDFRKAEVEKVRTEPVVIDDAVRGRVERAEETDFVLFRKNGEPVFHFVNVVDDLAMGITHVIRGEDHLSNTSKHVELFRALGAAPPVFAHIPLILKESGPGKMSKRDRGSLIEGYRERWFLPEAVRNYLALLGWSPKDDREKMSLDELIERFDFEGINRGNARFDERKLTALNTEYLRELPLANFSWMARPLLTGRGVIGEDEDEDYLQAVLALCQSKTRSLDELPEFVDYFFRDDFAVDAKAAAKVAKKGDPHATAAELVPVLEAVESWNRDGLEGALQAHAENAGVKVFAYFPALRLAVSGRGSGPDLLPMLEVMGRERVLRRLRAFAANG